MFFWKFSVFGLLGGPGGGGGGGGLGGVYSPLPKTLTLFITKICDIPYSIYDLTINSTLKSKPCFRPALQLVP